MAENNTDFFDTSLIKKARLAMKKDKYYFIPNAYSSDFCKKVCREMDEISLQKNQNGIERYYSDTEVRIWSAEKRSALIKRFYKDSNTLISKINAKNEEAGTVLAIKNRALGSCDVKNTERRWHIDSWRSQQKVFLFLTDTNEKSGPFEFIPETNKALFRMKKALSPGFFFDYKNFVDKNSSRPYQNINDENISKILSKGYVTKPAIVKAGTLLIADTSYLIHRARPCIEGERYALTSYYSVKKGFKDFSIESESPIGEMHD